VSDSALSNRSRRDEPGRAVYRDRLGACLIWTSIGFVAFVLALAALDTSVPAVGRLLSGVLALTVLVVGRRSLALFGVELSAAGIRVETPSKRRTIAWGEITAFRTVRWGRYFSVVVAPLSRERVRTALMQGRNMHGPNGNTRDVLSALDAALAAHSPEPVTQL
jgi:hypothetical protein